MRTWIAFGCGLLIGGFGGMLVMALCNIAKRFIDADEVVDNETT
jgi:hypothetical protein